MTTPVLPADTNTYGNLFGGHLVALIDKTASITAGRHAGCNVVTASIDRVDFLAPVRLGDILTVTSQLSHVGRTSMEVSVEVTREAGVAVGGRTPREAAPTRACTALLTFVAVGDGGRPTPVPPVLVDGESEEAAFAEGAARAAARRSRR